MTRHYLALTAALILALPSASAAQHDHGKSNTPAAKTAAEKKLQRALKPAEGASIKIVSPTKGQAIKGDKVPIEFKLTKGKRGHHAHAYVDGDLVGMFESAKGTLNGVKPGKHTLELRVVADDHQTELDAIDRVEFTVK
jgi:methionine-rich copper-binding protein CopC